MYFIVSIAFRPSSFKGLYSATGPDMGSIVYALVARNATILAESSAPGIQGNVATVSFSLIDKIRTGSEDNKAGDSRASYALERHAFHLLRSKGFTFLCVADQTMGRERPFAFLEDVRTRFISLHCEEASSAAAYSLNDAFSPVMLERLLFYNDPKTNTLSRVRGQVEELRGVMIDNIEQILERGERLELLVERTDNLAERTVVFKRGATKLRRQEWWRNVRTNVTVGGLALLGIYCVGALLCGPSLRHC